MKMNAKKRFVGKFRFILIQIPQGRSLRIHTAAADVVDVETDTVIGIDVIDIDVDSATVTSSCDNSCTTSPSASPSRMYPDSSFLSVELEEGVLHNSSGLRRTGYSSSSCDSPLYLSDEEKLSRAKPTLLCGHPKTQIPRSRSLVLLQ